MLEAACHSEARWPSVAIGLLLYWVAAEPRPAVVAAEPQLGRRGVPAGPSWAPAGPLWGPGWAVCPRGITKVTYRGLLS